MQTQKTPLTLDKMQVGTTCRVVGFVEMPRNKRRHLLDMGITRDCRITVTKKAPLGDPVSVTVRGYDLCLRKKDMSFILVEEEKI